MKLYKIFNLVALFHFGSTMETKPSSEGLLPPIPENRTITRRLERRLGIFRNSAFATPCTTNDTEEILSIMARNGRSDQQFRWRDFDAFVDPSFNTNERTLINNAMARLAGVIPCVNFRMYGVRTKPSGDYVHIVKRSGGCWSHIGKMGGRQELSLGSRWCLSVRLILHELIHALGFHHEQCRPDRDEHVSIKLKNVQPGMEHNFRKLDPRHFTTFGVPYNIHSIMQYGSYSFSVNRTSRPTITTKSGGIFRTGRDLQQTDIQRLKRMYNC